MAAPSSKKARCGVDNFSTSDLVTRVKQYVRESLGQCKCHAQVAKMDMKYEAAFQAHETIDAVRQQSMPLERRLELIKLLLSGIDDTAPIACQGSVLRDCDSKLDRVVKSHLEKKMLLVCQVEALAQEIMKIRNAEHAQATLQEVLLKKSQVLADEEAAISAGGKRFHLMAADHSHFVAQVDELKQLRADLNAATRRNTHEHDVLISLSLLCSKYEKLVAEQHQRQLRNSSADIADKRVLNTNATTTAQGTSLRFHRDTEAAKVISYAQSALFEPMVLQLQFGMPSSHCSLNVVLADLDESKHLVIKEVKVNQADFVHTSDIEAAFVGTCSLALLAAVVAQRWSQVAPLAMEMSGLRERFALDWLPCGAGSTVKVILGMKGSTVATLHVPPDYKRGGLITVGSVSGHDIGTIELSTERRRSIGKTIEYLTAKCVRSQGSAATPH